MNSHVALSVSIAVLGGIAAGVCLGPLSGIVLIWAVFIAWACYFALGGDSAALKNTIVCGILGAVLAWIGLLIFLSVPLADTLGTPIWAGIMVGITVLILCLLAKIELFSALPAGVLGYASVASLALQTPPAFTTEALTSIGVNNALIVIAISIIVGAVLGMLSGKLAEAITSS